MHASAANACKHRACCYFAGMSLVVTLHRACLHLSRGHMATHGQHGDARRTAAVVADVRMATTWNSPAAGRQPPSLSHVVSSRSPTSTLRYLNILDADVCGGGRMGDVERGDGRDVNKRGCSCIISARHGGRHAADVARRSVGEQFSLILTSSRRYTAYLTRSWRRRLLVTTRHHSLTCSATCIGLFSIATSRLAIISHLPAARLPSPFSITCRSFLQL